MREHNREHGLVTTAANWDRERAREICGPLPPRRRREYWISRRCPQNCTRPLDEFPFWMSRRARGLTRPPAPPVSNEQSATASSSSRAGLGPQTFQAVATSAAASSSTNPPPQTHSVTQQPAITAPTSEFSTIIPEPETQEYLLPQFTPINPSTATSNTPAPTITLRVPRAIPPVHLMPQPTMTYTTRDPNGPPSPPRPGVRRIRLFPYGREDQPLQTIRITLPFDDFNRYAEEMASRGTFDNPDRAENIFPDGDDDAGKKSVREKQVGKEDQAGKEKQAGKEDQAGKDDHAGKEDQAGKEKQAEKAEQPVIVHSPSPVFSPITPPPYSSD